mmetsp:Transcript_734/g.1044  ORF Transcript_734/g.1044 Transcript_734/m.1044 type:complete len:432 (+) Transcript_734:98-1393(+)
MILQLQAVLLSMPMLVVNAKVSQVMHSSGQNRREAKRVEQSLAKTQVQEQEQQCAVQGGGCLWDRSCCDEMECLGIVNWQCGYSPGREGEFCNTFYACDPDLLCYEGECTDYADILDYGEYEGTCAEGSPSGELKVMTYNTFLLSCVTGFGAGYDIPCQHIDAQSERVARMMLWVQTRDEDVIVFQELFNLRYQVTQGMVAAGFCHYVVTPFGDDGDGTAIFSKHPIGEIDFTDYYDFFGEDSVGVPIQAEAFATDRGIMEAEILKDGISHHVHNTHTLSNSVREEHTRRLVQYMAIRMAGANKSPNDSVLFAGDMNEDKYNHDVGDRYYQAMLRELDAWEPKMIGNQKFSYDNVNNPLPGIYYPPKEEEYQELLDYVLVSNTHLQPVDSHCEILTPVWPENCGNDVSCQVSDHYPVTCTYTFTTSVVTTE